MNARKMTIQKKSQPRKEQSPTRPLTKYAVGAIPLILLLVLVLILAIPLSSDLFLLGQRQLHIVDNDYSGDVWSKELRVSVKEIDPNVGQMIFDLDYVVFQKEEDEQRGTVGADATEEVSTEDLPSLDIMIYSGGIMSFSDGSVSPELTTAAHRVQLRLESPIVHRDDDAQLAVYAKSGIKIAVERAHPGYYYPFDDYFLRLNFYVVSESGESQTAVVKFQLDDPRFLHSRPTANRTHGRSLKKVPNSLLVEVRRPSYQKIFLSISLALCAIIVLWCFVRICFFPLRTAEWFEILGVNFAILLAVPDLRGLLVPSNLQVAPIFDFSVIVVWSLSLLTLAVGLAKLSITRNGADVTKNLTTEDSRERP